jgi:hypothetical protein
MNYHKIVNLMIKVGHSTFLLEYNAIFFIFAFFYEEVNLICLKV